MLLAIQRRRGHHYQSRWNAAGTPVPRSRSKRLPANIGESELFGGRRALTWRSYDVLTTTTATVGDIFLVGLLNGVEIYAIDATFYP